MPLELIRALRAIPSYYLRYYYLFDTVLADQRSDGHGTRAEEVIDDRARLLEMYRTRPSTRSRRCSPTAAGRSTARPPRSSSPRSTTAPATSRSSTSGTTAALPDLPPDAVVEIPARIDRDGAHPLPLAPLEPDMRGLVQAVKAYEELAIAAARSGDRARRPAGPARQSARPELGVAQPLLDALLEANRRPPAAVRRRLTGHRRLERGVPAAIERTPVVTPS